MSQIVFRNLVLVLGTFSALAGCAMFQPKTPPPPPGPAKPKPAFSWNADLSRATGGAAAITVNLSEQRAYFYKGKVLIGDTKCSSGKTGYATPPGHYKVTEKNIDHVSTLYGKFVDEDGTVTNGNVDMSKMKPADGETYEGAKMPYFMRFTAGFGLHAGIVPNHPASHGCVRLPRVMAQHFYENAVVGTPVTVQE